MVLEKEEVELSETAQLLKELNKFFCKKNSEEFGLTPEMLSEILIGANCSVERLVEALTQMNKSIMAKYYDKDNVFEVSKEQDDGGRVFVKGFSSNGKNNLYFFNENQKNPYFKIKSSFDGEHFSVKTQVVDGGVSFSDHGKMSVNKEEPFLYIANDFNQNKEKTHSKKNVRLHSHANTQNYKDETLFDEEFLNFYSIFVSSHDGQDSTLPSAESNQVLKNFLFDPIKNVSNFDYEIDFNELLKIVDYVIYDRVDVSTQNSEEADLSNISSFVCGQPQNAEGESGELFDINLGGDKKGIVKTKKYPGFCSIEIIDEKSEDVICNYIIYSTYGDGGFTIYRSIKDKNYCANKDNITNYTLNCNNGKITFSGSHTNREDSNLETFPLLITLQVNGDGSVDLSSNITSQNDNVLLKNSSSSEEMS